MDIQSKKISGGSEVQQPLQKKETSSDPTIKIKPIRTFAEDVAEAKKRAGIVDVEPKKKKAWGMKKDTKQVKQTIADIRKQLETTGVKKEITEEEKARIEAEGKKIVEKKMEDVVRKPKQLSDKLIRRELERSGVVAKETTPVPEEETSVKNIRTFRDDAVESVQDKKMSVVSIAASAEKRREKLKASIPQETPSISSKSIAVVIISIILVLSGAGTGWFFYSKSKTYEGIKPTQIASSIIFPDEQEELIIDNSEGGVLLDILDKARTSTTGHDSTIVHYYLTDNDETINANDFLSRISINVPNRLIRSVQNDFMFGVYVSDNNSPFIILKTTDFSNSFASMLDWEITMNNDLVPLFGEKLTSELRQTFNDVIVKNKDTRILRDPNGEIALMYAFPNTETIIITTDETTFFEVFKRLTTTSQTESR